MNDFEGRVAAITGAGSGIGRALALNLARRGTNLALSDVDPEGLAETVRLCERPGIVVTGTLVDVADAAAVEAWAAEVVGGHGRVDLIVNNAGVGLGATVEAMPHDDLAWLMDINFWGVVHGTKAFLPAMTAQGEGHVVNISSIFGLLSIPTQSAYNAAKFAVRGYTDALRIELEIAGSGVSATTVHPGGIKTNIARNARVHESVAELGGNAAGGDAFDAIAMTTAEKAAQQIVVGVERNRRRILVGPDAKAADLLSRLPAGVYQRLLIAGGRRAA